MADVRDWGQAANDNVDPAKGGWPEGMSRSDVNDRARDNLAALRRWYEDAEWVDLLEADNDEFTVTRVNTTTFRVIDGSGTDPTDKFPVGSWVRVTGTGAGLAVVLGQVATAGPYSAPNFNVELENLRDPADFSTTTEIPDTSVTQVECYFARSVKEAAFHPVGTTTGEPIPQIPTIDDLGTHVTKAEGSGGLIDADLLDGVEGAVYTALALRGAPNLLINGGFDVWQRGDAITGATAFPNDDGGYCADRWALLAEANDRFDVSRVDGASGPSAYLARLTSVNTTASPNAEKGGLLQVVENANTKHLVRDGKCSLGFSARVNASSGIANIRAAVLSWSSTADAVTRDCVATWGAEGALPGFAAGWSVLGDAQFAVTSAFQRFEIPDVTVPGSANNIAVFIWIDDKTYSLGDSLDLAGVKLEAGDVSGAFDPVDYAAELVRCQRYFEKTFQAGDAPAQNVGDLLGALAVVTVGGGADELTLTWQFKATKRAAPTVVTYNPLAANVSFHNASGGADELPTQVAVGDGAVVLGQTGSADLNDRYFIHATAEAEL